MVIDYTLNARPETTGVRSRAVSYACRRRFAAGEAERSPNNWRIYLYPDTYRSVTELAATIVHEFVHIVDLQSGDSNDEPNGPAERVGQYCATGSWPALRNPNTW